MKRLTKRILSVVVALAMVLSTITVTFAEDTKPIKVTMTIERFTIGQGFLVEPVTVELDKAEPSAKDVLEKVAAKEGLILNPPANQESGYFLSTISFADTGVLNIPQQILDMPGIDVDYGEYGKYHYDTPTNASINNLYQDNQKLGTGSYGDLAGWMYSVNNEASSVGMDAQPVQDGDVVRVQFSVYAAGADLGFTSWYENIESAKLANKDKLIRQVASVDAEGIYKEERIAAIGVLEKYDATQEEVDKAFTDLGGVEPATEEQTTIGTTENQESSRVKLDRVKIKRLTNVKKYRVKIKINKVKKAKGYQYKYATNRKFKKYKVKTTSKTTFTTKKLKKNARCYVKVRAYRKVNGTKSFGRWSKVKSVKVRK